MFEKDDSSNRQKMNGCSCAKFALVKENYCIWRIVTIVTIISISWPSLMTSRVAVQKIYSAMYLVSCTDTHRDVTDSANHGMVKNTKT